MKMPIFLTVTCYMIPEALTIISTMCMILLSDYVFPSASLNMENPSTERQAFFSLSKCIENMNHQCECIASCKLCKEKLPPDTKFDNACVRSYPRIRTPNKPHAGLDSTMPNHYQLTLVVSTIVSFSALFLPSHAVLG